MTIPLEHLVELIEETGIISGETLRALIPPKGSVKDADELVDQLVQQQKLTKYQLDEVCQGNGKSLTLGNYVLLEKIGAGGMGQVYKAQHRRMKRIVAVKMLPAGTMKDPASLARFEREVEAAAKISHPNIVAAHDADCANGVHFLVMELVEGVDLWAWVKKNGPLSVEKTISYIYQAAKGLDAAHRKGIVHRDIKPANLLLGTDGTVKVLDMGLARLEGELDSPTQADLTTSGTVMGTVDYMAPEQALNTKTADARADIYSLGCSLYFLLTGRPTYEGDTLMARLLAHRDQQIPSLRAIRPDVPDLLEQLFPKMVAKKLEDRYQSMTEVILDLEQCLPGMTTGQSLVGSASRQVPALSNQSVSAPTVLYHPEPNLISGRAGSPTRKYTWIGSACLGLAILAAIIATLRTKEGTLVVEVDQPDAVVQVLDAEGKIEVSQKSGPGTVSISVDPGKHRLKIEKEGFTIFGQDFEMQSGGQTPIKAKLVPLQEKPVMAEAKPASMDEVKQKPLAITTPEFELWEKQVAAMPAETQLEEVRKKLMELNPGFDGKLTGLSFTEPPSIEIGAVTRLSLNTDHVTDISPLRVFQQLTFLVVIGSPPTSPDGMPYGTGVLSDLSPLKGLRLMVFACAFNSKLSDLSPLEGMPLTNLACQNTRLSDLSLLKGMPLKRLNFCNTPVADLSPLMGMKLESLECYLTEVADLSPLKAMPLVHLHCYHTKVHDLSPLQGMPLENLTFWQTPVADLSPLKDMNLTRMGFTPNLFPTGIELVRRMKSLKTIYVDGSEWPADEFWKKYDAGDFGKKQP
ncbi:MAG: serine/threonine-protein kinase [Planctomycetaceae bacterium]